MLPKDAEAELTGRGFALDGDAYVGNLEIEQFGSFKVRILFAGFPYRLPEIFVDPGALPRSLAHVDSKGKVCIAPTSGILLDVSNPSGIIRDALQRATGILRRGLEGSSDPDFADEFLSYWYDGAPPVATFLSLLSPDSVPRPCRYCRLRPGKGKVPHQALYLISDTTEQAQAWGLKLDAELESVAPAFYLPLESPLPSPGFGSLEPGLLLETIQQHASVQAFEKFKKWQRKVVLPIHVVLSFPTTGGVTVFAFRMGPREIRNGGQYAFRKNQIRASVAIASEKNADKLRLERFDASFLLNRGGALADLTSHSVALVGCGSVGSFVAVFLALSGIGDLRLVDNQILTNENIHRHFLGVPHVGDGKAEAMAEFLSKQYPHLSFVSSDDDLAALFQKDPEFLDVDAVVLATGEETLELWANRKLHGTSNTVHCWNEPMGIGGHAVLSLAGQRGCYQCLFRRTDSGELYNAASFAAHGQNFVRSIAGCGGGYVPFSFLDSIRTAALATEATCRSLTGELTCGALMSWFGSETVFSNAGFMLSPRASVVEAQSVKTEENFIDSACEVCSPTE